MMHDHMRKHRRWLMGVLLVATVAIIFFGVPTVFDQNNQGGVDAAIATVGGIELKQSEFMGNLDAMANQGGQRKSYTELATDGTVDKVLESMIDSALITLQSEERGFEVDQDYLVEQMKEWQQFQDEDGTFNAAAWNAWLDDRAATDWNKLYGAMQEQTARMVYMRQALAAGGRVKSSDIDEQVTANYTKLAVKYAAVEPPVEVTDEQLRAFYDAAPQDFKEPDTLVAEYAAVSMLSDAPADLLALVKQAREGADFAQLVKDHGDTNKETGGDRGWQSPQAPELDHRAPMFALKVGEVSDPVAIPSGFYVYKVEEERTNAAGQREVKVRELFKRVNLDETERSARKARAEAIKEVAATAGDLSVPALAEGLAAQRTPEFNAESNVIAGIPRTDARRFASAFAEKEETPSFKVIEAGSNIYVARVAERREGRIPAYEEIGEKVREAYIKAEKTKQAYLDRVTEYIDKIKAQAASLQQAGELFPELNIAPAEAAPFTAKDFMVQGANLQSAQIATELKGKEPGAIVGPFQPFFGDKKSYLVELVSRTPPGDADKEKMDEDRKSLRRSQQARAQNAYLEDYLKDLRERMLPTVSVSIDQAAIDRLTGVEDEAETPAADGAPAPAADGAAAPAPASETPAPAVTVETAPAAAAN